MQNRIDAKAPVPIFNQIKNMILSRIASGELKPHDRLPSEREYEALLGASRQTVRRALDELVMSGILYRHPGKGTYVSDQGTAGGYVGISASTTLLAISPDHSFRTNRLEQVQIPSFVCKLLDLPESEQVILFEQLVCVRNEPRYIHRSFFPGSVTNLPAVEAVRDLSTLEILVHIANRLPLTSRDHISPGLCGSHDAGLLEIGEGDPVQIQRGIVSQANGLVVEAHEMIIRGDRFKMDFEFSINQHAIDRIRSKNYK